MRKLCVVFLVAILGSCASTRYRVNPSEQRRAFTGEVLVFEKSVPSSVSYRVIGDYVMQKQWYGGTGETARYATEDAAAKGANAILIERTGHRVTAWSWASPYTEGKLLWVENYQQARTPHLKQDPNPAAPTVENRLTQLDALRDKGKITEEEYAERRSAILGDL